jgi:hypothetical protein
MNIAHLNKLMPSPDSQSLVVLKFNTYLYLRIPYL